MQVIFKNVKDFAKLNTDLFQLFRSVCDPQFSFFGTAGPLLSGSPYALDFVFSEYVEGHSCGRTLVRFGHELIEKYNAPVSVEWFSRIDRKDGGDTYILNLNLKLSGDTTGDVEEIRLIGKSISSVALVLSDFENKCRHYDMTA